MALDIQYAILAELSGGPASGYDLKKRFAESESLHWSGNNNQVYRALMDLHERGLLSREVDQPYEGPARKVYSLTGEGTAFLREWLLGPTETPALRLPVVVKLLGAGVLSREELDRVLGDYAEEVRLRLAGVEELARRRTKDATPGLQAVIGRAIEDRPARFLRAEADWVAELRWSIARAEKETNS